MSKNFDNKPNLLSKLFRLTNFIAFGKKLLSPFFSRQPKFYTVRFGPIKGMKLFTTFLISPRMLFGVDETWIAEIAKTHLKEGDVVYDVGAHIGYTSLLFSKLVGSMGKVHAFELLPNVASEFLSKTISANNLADEIIVHPIGLSDKQEDLLIYIGETMMGTLDTEGHESGKIEKCRTETLDQYLIDQNLTPPNVIKVDIERAENKFLAGAASVIEQYKPKMIIEFHSIELLREGYQLLKKMNYNLETANGLVTEEYLEVTTSFHSNTLATANSKL